MFRKCYLIFFVLWSFVIYSQKNVTVTGKLLEESTRLPLESATVYFSKAKDSTVVDYTISDQNGNFTLKMRAIDEPVYLKVSYNGFKEYKKKFEAIKKDFSLETIYLQENISNLNEVVVKSEIPPVLIKTDTLEFNASSFKVSSDANVEALLKQLPGVTIDKDGKIMVNGKEVKNVLVNGKPFFGKDGKIATQNLPAELIDKIQVTDAKTKEEELSGSAASENASTINLTIQKDKNKGLFGKATAGYGSDKRYESSLLFNYFKDTQKISVLGSSNNINAIGFSMDEIFDNMGGGRNTSVWMNDNGSFGINGLQFGGNVGLTKSNMLGFNFADEWFGKKIDPNGNYYYSQAITDNKNRTERINLLPTGSTKTLSNSKSNTHVTGHNLSLDIEMKINSTTTLYFSPTLTKNNGITKYESYSSSFDTSNNLLNENSIKNSEETNATNFSNNFYLYKKLKKKGRGLSFSLNNLNNKNGIEQFILNNTIFHQSGNPDDLRNQKSFGEEKKEDYGIVFSYTEPVLDSLVLSFETSLFRKNIKNVVQTFDFNSVDNGFTILNDLLSNSIFSEDKGGYYEVGIRVQKKKLRGSIEIGSSIHTYSNQSIYLGVETRLKNRYIFPRMNGYFSYTLGKSKSIYSYYSYTVDLPTAQQLLPFENLSNPLNIIVGNEFLKPAEKIRTYFSFRNYDYSSRSGYYTYFGGVLNKNKIVSSTIYDGDFRAKTTYENVNQTYNFYGGINLNKSFKKEKRTIQFSAGIDVNYTFDQGLTNLEKYEARSVQLKPKASFTWSIDELITIEPSYKYTFNTTSFNNYLLNRNDNFIHNLKFETTTYWPKKFVLGNDFGYTFNSNISKEFQRDFYLWNISLGYHFSGDKWLAKVKIYDLLNQNVSAVRSVSPISITDSENTVLQRYVMFSLTYKLEKFGGKKKSDFDFFD